VLNVTFSACKRTIEIVKWKSKAMMNQDQCGNFVMPQAQQEQKKWQLCQNVRCHCPFQTTTKKKDQCFMITA